MIGKCKLVGEPQVGILKVEFVHFGWDRNINASFLAHCESAFEVAPKRIDESFFGYDECRIPTTFYVNNE